MSRFFLLSFLLYSSVAAASEPSRAYQVVKVVDGDTFEATDGVIRFRVRIAGADTPERGAPYNNLATAALKERIEGTTVTVAPVGRGLDRYNRVLAVVTADQKDVAVGLIEDGLATYDRPRCVDSPENKQDYEYDPRPYVAAEAKARLKKAYLWSDAKPILPCQWRKAEARSD